MEGGNLCNQLSYLLHVHLPLSKCKQYVFQALGIFYEEFAGLIKLELLLQKTQVQSLLK